MWMTAGDAFDSVQIPRCASKTNHVTETAIKQILDDSRTNKTCSSGHKDRIVLRNNVGIFHEVFSDRVKCYPGADSCTEAHKNCGNRSSPSHVNLRCYGGLLMDSQP